jgi:hypothetical protein
MSQPSDEKKSVEYVGLEPPPDVEDENDPELLAWAERQAQILNEAKGQSNG